MTVPSRHLSGGWPGCVPAKGAGGKPVVYCPGAAPKMIKVDERTHARLAELAAEHGTTIGGYVGELVRAQRTHAEWEAIGQQTNDYLDSAWADRGHRPARPLRQCRPSDLSRRRLTTSRHSPAAQPAHPPQRVPPLRCGTACQARGGRYIWQLAEVESALIPRYGLCQTCGASLGEFASMA